MLANSKQAIKRVKQGVRNKICNKWQRSRMVTYIAKVMKSVSDNKAPEALAEYKLAASYIDRLVIKGIIHKNKAARHKSRLSKHIQKIAS